VLRERIQRRHGELRRAHKQDFCHNSHCK
jgi:hypothetical protein